MQMQQSLADASGSAKEASRQAWRKVRSGFNMYWLATIMLHHSESLE
jgi:hypothetical protein